MGKKPLRKTVRIEAEYLNGYLLSLNGSLGTARCLAGVEPSDWAGFCIHVGQLLNKYDHQKDYGSIV